MVEPAEPQQKVSASAAPATPGALHGEVWLQIHTREAQRLVNGRPAGQGKAAILGLMGFARLLRPIRDAAHDGDPYACWWLQRIEASLADARTFLHERHLEMTAVLARCAGLEITPAVSVAPVRFPLRFGDPYAFHGAQLITQLDPLASMLLTARHVALLSPDDTRQRLSACNRVVRRAFASVQGYRRLGIGVDDVLQANARAEQARQAMGELPREFL